MSRLVGTGTDPLGRWPKDVEFVPGDEAERESLLAQGYVREVTKLPPRPTAHEPVEDAYGVLRVDRPFTPEEAVEIDAANRDQYVKLRRARFERRPRRRRPTGGAP